MLHLITRSSGQLLCYGSSKLDDVTVHTSLPPQVEGQLRCHLRLGINQILWLIPNPPELTHVRAKWWGEEAAGSIFRPLDVKKGNKDTCRTTARYAVRSGPKQFAAYLQDANSLILDVLAGNKMVIVAKAVVDALATLTPVKPVNGFFAAISADNEKVAEVQVSVVLETLMASYDSTSSIPTPDISTDVHSSWASEAPPVKLPSVLPLPMPQPKPVFNYGEDPFASPNARKFPKGIDPQIPRTSLRNSWQTEPDTTPSTSRVGLISTSFDSVNNVDAKKLDVKFSGNQTARLPQKDPWTATTLSSQNVAIGSDLVSQLLTRGTKLREAMIVSTMDVEKTKPVKDVFDSHNYKPASPAKFNRTGSNGSLFKEILDNELPHKPSDEDTRLPLVTGLSTEFGDTEDNAIDLVLGDDAITENQWKVLQSLHSHSERSSESGEDYFSDPGDPIHDEDILQELFYKSQDSDCSDVMRSEKITSQMVRRSVSLTSLDEPGNMRPPSRHSSVSSLPPEEPVRDTDRIPPSPPRPRSKKEKSTTATLR